MAQTSDLDAHGEPSVRQRPDTPSACFNRNLDRSRRILFADASEVSRAVATLQLKHLGFSVDGVSEANSLSTALASNRYRTILIADNIRLEPNFELANPNARVLLLTHSAAKSERLPPWAEGALLKPLTLRILSEALGPPSTETDSITRA